MLGAENQVNIADVIKEIMETDISKISKIKLLQRLKGYEGLNDDFSFIDEEIKVVRERFF